LKKSLKNYWNSAWPSSRLIAGRILFATVVRELQLWLPVIFAIPVFSSCHPPLSQSPTFYVSPSGNDANSGTSIHHAWRSVQHVNDQNLLPGSTVFFEGGASFAGTIELKRMDSANEAFPITISSYGKGYALIDADTGLAFKAENCNYFQLRKLQFTGRGRKEGNRSDGAIISGCNHVLVDSLEISGFQHSGLSIFKCSNLRITNVYAHDNGFAGIHVWGTTIWDKEKYDNHNIYIANCVAENNPGDPTVLNNHSGNGILASSVKGGVIEYCEAFNNGWDMPWHGNGPVGIWIWDCADFIIQYCISHDNKTAIGAADGGGFDLDGGVSNSVIQYCLSYHNQGPGIGLFEFGSGKTWENNTIRYNISHNDGTNGQGSLSIWKGEAGGTILNCEIYNNTFYNSNPGGPDICLMKNLTGFNFRNNIFVFNGSLLFKGHKIKDELFQNNCYWNLTGDKKFLGYPDIAGWAMAKGKELFNGKLTCIYADPMLNDTSTNIIKDPHSLSVLHIFNLMSASPLIDAGYDIRALNGGTDVKRDFAGSNVPQGKGFDIGALEFSAEK
jgi:hypothetical protein